MNLRTILGLFLGMAAVTRFDNNQVVSAEATQSPLRFRANSELLSKIIHTRDQEVLSVFKDTQLEGLTSVDAATFSLGPKQGAFDDFDFDLSYASDNLGASSTNILVSGTATVDGKPIKFSVPVSKANLQFAMDKRLIPATAPTQIEFEQLVWDEVDSSFTLDAAAF